jgi:hypothetical protein
MCLGNQRKLFFLVGLWRRGTQGDVHLLQRLLPIGRMRLVRSFRELYWIGLLWKSMMNIAG